MIVTTAIKSLDKDPFLVTWNLGRRCNYDCSYCESNIHTNYSPHTRFDELLKTYEFIKSWAKLYSNGKSINIDFTGGEPTTNPDFWKLAEYIRNDSPDYFLALTTNGTWGKKNLENVKKHFNGVTISYHAEADEELKNNCVDNIIEISKHNLWMQVNIMLHQDHFNECVGVYQRLKAHGISCNLRPIGDGNVRRVGWFSDSEGIMRRTSHEYTIEQQEWFWNEMGIKKKAENKSEGTDIGRSCCGNRCLSGKVDGNYIPIKLVDTHFKDWYCMVDHYFLHIDQENKLVYHHQTCKAKHGKQRGPIGSLDNIEQLLSEATDRLIKNEPIICPNDRCNCGMCVPKAKDKEEYDAICKQLQTTH